MKIDADRLTNENATVWLERGQQAIRSGDTTFDLSQVAAVDSAAVALVLAWQREAAASGKQLSFVGVPAGMASLARLYGVDALLALQAA
ncbi:MAG TPA: STAS domain-containing protein [Burkholderiaceae bacterium]|nr:STAS domain-containing protein [Burkholderiaceae bacterium]